MTEKDFGRFLTTPATDRIVAVSLGGYWLYQSLTHSLQNRQGWPLIALTLSALVGNLLIIFRRKPEKISLNVVHWAIALLACNWWLIFGGFSKQGTPLVPENVTSLFSALGLILSLGAKLSLWRSFGVIPAKRKLQTKGLYGIVRHPIYGIEFLMLASFILGSFSPINAILAIGAMAADIGQALAEEKFFEDDPEYLAYRAKVKKRFIPFVV